MKRILVPIDFTPAMDAVLELAQEMTRALAAELHLVHVRDLATMPVALIGFPGMGVAEIGATGGVPLVPPLLVPDPSPNEKRSAPLDARVEELTRRGLRVTLHQSEGTVVEEILRIADEISADLIVMGSHSHGSVYNLFIGSVTEGVLKAGARPILLVPAPTQDMK